jgi:hypothetical protein
MVANVSVDINLTYKLVKDLSPMFSELLDQSYLDKFYSLKSNVEGWKKGNLLKVTGQKQKTTSEVTKENLTLYINQITHSNYNITKNKIQNEIDNEMSINSLIDLILNDAIRQSNNLCILADLIIDLDLYEKLVLNLESKLDIIITTTKHNSEYDKFCSDNTNNLIFKNRFVLLGYFYKHGLLNNIDKYLDILKNMINNLDKSKNEIYVLTLVELLKSLDNKTQFIEYYNYLEELSTTKLITTKSIITILNLLD